MGRWRRRMARQGALIWQLVHQRGRPGRNGSADRPARFELSCPEIEAIGGFWERFPTLSEAFARAEDLFAPVGTVVRLADEELMHAATAVSGSSPAYLYAFVEALEAGGVAAGLSPEAAADLVRSTIAGAAALMSASAHDPAELRRQVTSPGGTTQAALDVLMGEDGFGPLLRHAVAAAVRRSRELGT